MEIARKELGDQTERLPATTYERGGMGESLIWGTFGDVGTFGDGRNNHHRKCCASAAP